MSARPLSAVGRIEALEPLGPGRVGADRAALDLVCAEREAAAILYWRLAALGRKALTRLPPLAPRRGLPRRWRAVPPFALSAPRLRLIGAPPPEAAPSPRLWRAEFAAKPVPLHAVGQLRLELRLLRLTPLGASQPVLEEIPS